MRFPLRARIRSIRKQWCGPSALSAFSSSQEILGLVSWSAGIERVGSNNSEKKQESQPHVCLGHHVFARFSSDGRTNWRMAPLSWAERLWNSRGVSATGASWERLRGVACLCSAGALFPGLVTRPPLPHSGDGRSVTNARLRQEDRQRTLANGRARQGHGESPPSRQSSLVDAAR